MRQPEKPSRIEYEKMYQVESEHWWYRGLRCVLLYWVEKFSPEEILDAGCGTGLNMLTLRSLGYKVRGIDYSQDSIEFCQARNLQDVSKGSIQNLPYSDDSFGLIYSLDVLGCLEEEDAVKAVKEFYRCLKPNGICILNTAALEFLRSVQDDAWHVKKRYDLAELEGIFESSGFSIYKSTYRIFFLFPIVMLYKLAVEALAKLRGVTGSSDTDKTHPLVNVFLTPVMILECFLHRYINFPLGSSVFIVARKQ